MKQAYGPGSEQTADPEVVSDILGDEGETSLARVNITALATGGDTTGEFSQKDIVLPYLKLIQGVGKLSRVFKPGDWVLSGESAIAKEGEEFILIALNIAKYFQERFPRYDPNGPKPRIFAGEKAVLDAGLTTEWKGTGKDRQPATAEPVADITCLIAMPNGGNEALFPLTIQGKPYAMAVWTCRSTAYTRVAKRVFTAKSIELATTGLIGGRWSVHSRETEINGNLIKAPVINLVGRNDEATIAEIKSLIGAK